MNTVSITGGCLCGAVRFSATGARETVNFCHCSQCRRSSGHYWAATRAPLAEFTLSQGDGLTWYKSSDWAKRGFCNRCGASLFYQVNDADHIGIAAGCVDNPSGLKPGKHIFTDSKGDYYDIADGLEQIPD